MSVALRVSLIWHDEVFEDVVLESPRTITLGARGRTTFTVADLGLPPKFAVIRPGKRGGYVVTLGEQMRGTICVEGQERDVRDLVRVDGSGGFAAVTIRDNDWGVIDLDADGAHKLFFQWVPLEASPVFLTGPVLAAGVAGYLLSGAGLTAIWHLARGLALDESAFRGFGIATLILIAAGIIVSAARQDGETQASLAFSVILHVALLLLTYELYVPHNPFVWPGPRSLTGQYLVTRLDPRPTPETKPPSTVGTPNKEQAAAASPTRPKKTATRNDEGASGGKGEQERARTTDPTTDKPEAPKIAFLEDKNRKVLDNIIDRNLATGLTKFQGIQGDAVTRGSIGFGPGTGSGVGAGTDGFGTTRGSKKRGSGGGGKVEGDFVSNKGPIDTGKERPGGNCVGPSCQGAAPKAVALKIEDATGDFSGLSKDEIDRVVRARAGVFRACYQKELNRSPGLGGKLVINFVIAADGSVKSSRTNGGTLKNDGVEACVKSNIMRLKFPAKGGAIVNYPFVFTQGG